MILANPAAFFASIRVGLFNGLLSQNQVDGMNIILAAWDTSKQSEPRFVAYSLATVSHETAQMMQPITEFGLGRGHTYGLPAGPFGQRYYGRGLVQLTWLDNYQKTNDKLHARGVLRDGESLVAQPDLTLRPDVAAAILVYGMLEGWFTGRKLSDFFNETEADWVNAREIINGHDKAAQIAAYAIHFHDAILGAQ